MPSSQHLWDLQQLIELHGRDKTERMLGVHRTTVTRWLDGRVSMPVAQRTMVQWLNGNLPGTDGQWTGWATLRPW